MRTTVMIATVQCYIHIHKGMDVDIQIPQTNDHLFKLVHAYQVARDWMANNNVKMTSI